MKNQQDFIFEESHPNVSAKTGPIRSGLVLGSITLFVGVVGALSLVTLNHSIQAEIKNKLVALLNTSVASLEVWIQEKKNTVSVWATNDEVRKYVIEQLDLASDRAIRPDQLIGSKASKQLRKILGPVCRVHELVGFVVVSPTGVNVSALLDEPIGKGNLVNHIPSDFVSKALQGEIVVSRPFKAGVLLPDPTGVMRPNRPTMFSAAPVRGHSGEIIAALCFRIRPEGSFTRILSLGRFGESVETYAIDKNGLILSDSRFNDHLRMIGLLPDDSSVNAILNIHAWDPGGNLLEGFEVTPPLALTRMAHSAVHGNTDFDFEGYRDYRGVTVVGAWTWLDRYGFGVTTEQDYDEAYADLFLIKKIFYGLLVMLFFFTLIVIWLDRVNRKRTELIQVHSLNLHRALQKIEHQKLALDQHAIVSITDVQGHITYANDKFCEISQYSREELLGQNHRIIKSDEHASEFFREMWLTISKGQVWHGDFKNRRKDGTFYWVNSTIVPFKNNRGQIEQYLAVRTDITEHRNLLSQLSQAQKLESIGQLAAGVAHEINTPILFVGNNTRFLKDSFEDLQGMLDSYKALLDWCREEGVASDLVDKIQSNIEQVDLDYLSEEIPKSIQQTLEGVERVAVIVRSMKEFSHPGVKEKSQIDLNAAIDSTITVSTNEWKYVAELVREFSADLPLVPCYPGEFNQVVLNIIVNAAHAIGAAVEGDQKGRITVQTDRVEGYAEVRISDTGTGIPDEIRQKIFDPFFTTKKVGKGTGQGLAIAHNVIVEKLGGELLCNSEVGQGTTFIVRLPLDDGRHHAIRRAS